MVTSDGSTDDLAAGDAERAHQASFDWEEASQEHRTALVNAMLPFYGHDVDRIEAALGVARSRCAESDLGWDEAVEFLEQTLHRLRAAGADESDAARDRFADQLRREMYPDPVPYQWPDRRSWHRRGWRRTVTRARVRWEHKLAGTRRAGHQLLLLHLGGTVVGKLDYQVCDQCRRGLVRKLDVDDRYRGLGLGTLAIRRMRRRHPGYAWRTTVHYATAGTFWTNVSTEPEQFLEDSQWACEHMDPGHR